MAVDSSGNLYVSGILNQSSKNAVLKYDGTSWTEVGTLNTNGSISTMCFDMASNLYVAGEFTKANGKRYVAKWDGTNWVELGTGSNSLNADLGITVLCADVIGNIYAGGEFTNSNSKRYIAKWDGNTWTELGTKGSVLKNDLGITSICSDRFGNIYTAANSFTNNKFFVAKLGYGVGSSSIPNSAQFEIYPNPTNNIINIQHTTSQKEELVLYNILGEIIYKDKWYVGQSERSIDVGNFAKGVYIVRIGDAVHKVAVE